MSQSNTIRYIVVRVRYGEDGDLWVGECDELETYAYGKKYSTVKKDMRKLLEHKIALLNREGILEKYLKERSIKIRTLKLFKSMPFNIVHQDGNEFAIPIAA